MEYCGDIKNLAEIEQIFQDCPKRADGYLPYPEFTAFINKQNQDLKRDEVRESFHKYDDIRLKTSN